MELVKPMIVLAVVLAATQAWSADRQTATRAYQDGLSAEFAGDYSTAQVAFERALSGAAASSLGAEFTSAATYNLGRIVGYRCDFPRAKELLLEALKLEQSLLNPNRANVTKRLSELARLSYDQGAFTESVHYYDRVVPELEDLGVVKLDPNGCAIFLDDYALALSQAGESQRAGVVREKANGVRLSNQGVPVRFRPTYYRDVCAKK
jgi:tetratricopeptide (TPR) repeat protein